MSSENQSGSTDHIAKGRVLAIASVDLVVVDGPDRGKRARITRGSARIGTAKGSALVLGDPTVSRLHCEILVGAEGVSLRDAGSTNGTFVDGRRVRDVDLTQGTIVVVGGTSFRVDIGDRTTFVELSSRTSFGDVVGGSVAMRRIYAVLEKAAATDATVLVLGETGTGKELVARALHEESRRAEGPFVVVDCGAIPENLIESELFGHVRGAFSGAINDRKGAFEEADGGTIFFDEIGELPLTLQPKLLRALELREVRRVGSNQRKSVDVRVIAATNRPLAKRVNEGTFREDLYFRLAVIDVELPPLRARAEDVPQLAAHFVERLHGARESLSPALLSAMTTREWPGNVRELRNFVERSLSLGWPDPNAVGPAPPAREGELSPTLGNLVPVHLPLKDARVAWIGQFETVYVRALLERTKGNVTRAAEIAGVTRRFLQRTLVRIGLRPADVVSDDDEGQGT